MENVYEYNLCELEKLNFLSLFEVHYLLIKGEEDIDNAISILKKDNYGSDIAYKKGLLKALYYRETGEYDLMAETLKKIRVKNNDSQYKKEVYYSLKRALIYTLLAESYQYTEDTYVLRTVHKAIKIYGQLFGEYVDFKEGECLPGESLILKRTICESYLYALLIKKRHFPEYEDLDGYNYLMKQIYDVLKYIELTSTIKMALSYAGVHLMNDYVKDNTENPFEVIYSDNVSIIEPHKEILKVLKQCTLEVYYPCLLLKVSQFYSIRYDNELLKYIKDESLRLKNDYPLTVLHIASKLLSIDQYDAVEVLCKDLKLNDDKYDCIRISFLDRTAHYRQFENNDLDIKEYPEIELTPSNNLWEKLLFCLKVLLTVLFVRYFSLSNTCLSLMIDCVVVYLFFNC